MSRFTRVVIFDWNEFPGNVETLNKQIDDVMSEDVRFIRDFARL